ncbi:MAG: hypothetical protein MMC33_007858 [Icmadophila ericetorum]|nr:hypothetical protein [Icmadophila ericetorum]
MGNHSWELCHSPCYSHGGNSCGDKRAWRKTLHAYARGSVRIAALLLEKGTNVNEKDGHQVTPLHRAIRNSHEPVIHFLLTQTAGVDFSDTWLVGSFHRTFCRATYLCTACYSTYSSVVQLLLDKDQDVTSQYSDERTPLYYALIIEKGQRGSGRSQKHQDLVDIARLRGADVFLTFGPNPRRLAAIHLVCRTLCLLKEYSVPLGGVGPGIRKTRKTIKQKICEERLRSTLYGWKLKSGNG